MKYFIGFFALLILCNVNVKSQDFISAKDFMAELKKNKELVVIDANTAENYGKRHVRGAINIPHKELYNETEIKGLLKSPEELGKYFGEKGVGNTDAIVVYDNGSGKFNSRVYWVLKYLGAENVKLLHKDLEKSWRAARIPLISSPTKPKAKTFTVKLNNSIYATMDDVKAGNAMLVDARSSGEYNGTSEKPVSKGHIPGAINIEYKEFLQDNGNFKSKEEIEAVAKKHGLDPSKPVILYCETSVRACPIFVALTSVGYGDVKVYDGAYNEWVTVPNNPIEK
ncbi:MAG: hypothetical protein B6I19_01780 [Bacteroidetes bacterium 4572_114]|nr:MAG: hypothetical protein B6I19_01780 [Bacteroidetes bacterium 4572_114]